MSHKRKSAGFSLTEVLMSVGILGVGMLFIAGTFPVAIHFNTVATERTKAALAADEAFAKIKLYGLPKYGSPPQLVLPFVGCVDFNDVWYQYALLLPNPALRVNPGEFVYPSADIPLAERQYRWSALCRRVGSNNVQVTVFVSRITGAGRGYWDRDAADQLTATALVSVPVWVQVTIAAPGLGDIEPEDDRISIVDANPNDGIYEKTLINAGCTIVDNKTGQLYRVLERYAAPDDDSMLLLDRRWLDSDGSGIDFVWVVPPAVGGGRYPCVAVYQRVIRF